MYTIAEKVHAVKMAVAVITACILFTIVIIGSV